MKSLRPVMGCLTIAAAILSLQSMAWAQSPQPLDLRQRGFEAIDQHYDDIDPSTRSLRRVEQGLNQNRGQESMVYRRTGADGQQKFYFIRDGIIAEYDRSEYLRVENKQAKRIETLTVIPANTVFHIGLPAQTPAQPLDPRPDPRLGAPLTDLRSHDTGRVESADEARQYLSYRQTQTRLVVSAIDRVMTQTPEDPASR